MVTTERIRESPAEPAAREPGCCHCSGLCRKIKKIFCLQESYDVSFDTVEPVKKIMARFHTNRGSYQLFHNYDMLQEHSAPEYGLKYEHALEEPLSTGCLVVVTATPSEDIPRFAINVGNGDSWSDRTDIIFHFNPRMPQRYVVRNSRKTTSWGTEETTSFRSFPFKPGGEFKVELMIAENEWLVAVNGEHYCSFAHRLPVASATWVQVTDIAQPHVHVRRTDVYPLDLPTPLEAPHRLKANVPPEPNSEPLWRPNSCALLPKGIKPGQQVVVSGRVRALPHSFHLELAEEWHEWPHPAVHLHVNPRLCAAPTRSHQLVVLNSWLQGCWGQERRQATARIIGGTNISMRLVRGESEWLIWADDVLLGEFPFRADPDQVQVVRVRGDLLPTHIYTAPAD